MPDVWAGRAPRTDPSLRSRWQSGVAVVVVFPVRDACHAPVDVSDDGPVTGDREAAAAAATAQVIVTCATCNGYGFVLVEGDLAPVLYDARRCPTCNPPPRHYVGCVTVLAVILFVFLCICAAVIVSVIV